MIGWLIVWLGYCAATAAIMWSFGCDLTHRGLALGIYLLICLIWTLATMRCVSEERRKLVRDIAKGVKSAGRNEP